MMWALCKLKHAPERAAATFMLGTMVALCHLPGRRPTSQGISNVLLACAELRLILKQKDVDTLLSCLFNKDRQQGTQQVCCNTAWALAVSGSLQNDTMNKLLDQLLPSDAPQVMFTRADDLAQLYQALDWLQPSLTADAKQQIAWS